MPSAKATRRHRRPAALLAILCGGFLCGALDISAAFVIYGSMGLRPFRLLQGITSGLLGPSAFAGGWATALLGLFFEFFISTGAAAVYVFAAHFLGFLTRRPALAGPLYGIAVYWFMQLIVLPLSRFAHRPFSLEITLIGIAIHMVCVGPPIAIAARYFTSRAP
jgi:ABC-type multidrug transport system fused ATPase/permease subunit